MQVICNLLSLYLSHIIQVKTISYIILILKELLIEFLGSKYVKIWKINVPTIDENGSDMQKENSLDSEGLKDGKSF